MERGEYFGLRNVAGLAALVAALDQLTKLAVIHFLQRGETLPIVAGVFNLTRVHNRGTAFGLFPRHSAIFIVLSLATIAVVIAYYRRLFNRGILVRISAGLILGGAAGNLVDRLFRGAVVDFLDFYLRFHGQEYHWPAFNLADGAICLGVGILVVSVLFQKRSPAGDRG